MRGRRRRRGKKEEKKMEEEERLGCSGKKTSSGTKARGISVAIGDRKGI